MPHTALRIKTGHRNLVEKCPRAFLYRLRLRYLGAYALEESGTQKSSPFWTANLKLGYRFSPKVQLTLDVLNLFDRKANDIEYWGVSCTRSEGSGCDGGDGISGRMMHPMEPHTLRAGLRINF